MGRALEKRELSRKKNFSEIHIRILSSLLLNIKLHLCRMKAHEPRLTTTRVLSAAKQLPELRQVWGVTEF